MPSPPKTSGWSRKCPISKCRDVSLVYDTPSGRVTGVQGASFHMEQSEFLCLVGPSGCGKSTLLNIIAGFLAPTGGTIRIGGKAVTGQGMDRGVVFQDFAQLFPVAHRARQCRVRAGDEGRRQGRARGDRARAAQARRSSKNSPAPIRITFRAACSSGSRSRGRWPTIRRCC